MRTCQGAGHINGTDSSYYKHWKLLNRRCLIFSTLQDRSLLDMNLKCIYNTTETIGTVQLCAVILHDPYSLGERLGFLLTSTTHDGTACRNYIFLLH